MTQQVGELNVGVNVDEKDLVKSTKKVQKSFKEAGDAGAEEMEKSAKEWVSKSKGIFSKLSSSLKNMFWEVGSSFIKIFAIQKLWSFIKSIWTQIITLAGNLEQATIAFTTMLWSWKKAETLLNDLSDFAKKTPFELVGIRQNAKQLLAMGIEADKIIPTLKSLGDVSSGLSVPLEQVAYAYWQVRSANQLYWTELRQFMNAGVPLLSELAKMYNVTEAEARKMVEDAKIWFSDVEQAFVNMSSEGWRFNDMMTKQSITFQGMVSNLQDSINIIGEGMGNKLLPFMKWLVEFWSDIASVFEQQENSISKLADSTKTLLAIYEEQTARLEELNEEYENWMVTEEDYRSELESLTYSINDNVAQIETQVEALDRLKDLQILINMKNEEAKRIMDDESLSVEAKREKMLALKDAIDELKRKQEEATIVSKVLAWSFDELWFWIDALSTAKSVQEFDKLKAKQIESVHASKAVVDAAYAQALALWDDKAIFRNIEAIEKLNMALYELEKAEYTASKSSGGAWGSRKSGKSARQIQMEKEAKEAEKLKKEEEKLEKQKLAQIEKDNKEFQKRKQSLQKETAKKEAENFKNLSKVANDVYKIVTDWIKDAEKSIASLTKEIDGINQDLEENQVESGVSIAERAVEIQNKLDELKKGGNLSSEDYQTRIDLEKELALAQQSTTQDLIEDAKLRSEETVTQRLIREAEEEELALQIKKARLEKEKEIEVQNLQQLEAEKVQLMQAFNNADIKLKQEEKNRVNDLYQAYVKLNRERTNASTATWTAPWFATGGYTGNVSENKVAGVVHGGEWVAPARMVKKMWSVFNNLEWMRNKRGFKDGWNVSNSKSQTNHITINDGVDVNSVFGYLKWKL